MLPAASSTAGPTTQIRRLHVLPRPTRFPSSIYTPQPADIHIARAVLPAPYDPRLGIAGLGRTALANQAASILDVGRRFAQRFASAPPNDHEGEGVFMFGNAPPYNALFATQTAYEALQRPLTFPDGAVGAEQIFVPTMHPGWGSCLENSSYYVSSPGGDSAHFTVFNFCQSAPTFIFDAIVDREFLRDYVRITPGGLQSYVSEIFTPDVQPSATSTWFSILYNFRRHRYDIMASIVANGYQADAFGWSIVEPYDAQGPCPQIAPALVTGLSAHNTATGVWDPVSDNMAGGAYSFIGYEAGSPNSCLVGDATGNASMNFDLIIPNSEWEVTSPRSDP